jgi:hypothetical protein
MGGGTSNDPAPSSTAFALHQRSGNTNSSTNTIIEDPIMNNNYTSDTRFAGGTSTRNSITASQYFSRLTDISQMDVQSAFDQMKSLLIPSQSHRVYKTAYYRKQTKGHYARDDPAFLTLQISFLMLSSVAYSIAFNSDSFFSTMITFIFHSVVINYILVGVVVATAGQFIANQYLAAKKGNGKSNNNTSVEPVEWMYAFDIHCNAFFPFFVIVYIIQYFLLPIVLSLSFFAFFVSNTIYSIAFGYYFYIMHLGYRTLPQLNNTELLLSPIVVVIFIFVLNLVGYPFGLGWNASRIMAHLYFES